METSVERAANMSDAQELASDAELISASRSGDDDAYAELCARHRAAAMVVALHYASSPAEAEGLVSEVFAQIFRLLQEGGGPDSFFRASLFASILQLSGEAGCSPVGWADGGEDLVAKGPAPEGLTPKDAADQAMIRAAFTSLPERWRSILWYAEIEGLSAEQIAPVLGLSPNGATALLHRATEGLREAFFHHHMSTQLAAPCRSVAGHLPPWARGALASRERERVDDHLAVCEACRRAGHGLTHIPEALPSVIGPEILGGAGFAAILQALREAPTAHGATTSPADGDAADHGASKTAGGAEKAAGGTADAGSAPIQRAPVSASPAWSTTPGAALNL